MAALSVRVFLVCHFVHPDYPHDRTQMHRPRVEGWTARLHGISCL
ncbi:hypothetical protein NP493_216g03071 [Ridgeia piscesae]|uniref:Uncharacterized protein n=1 Tax=Ridgeia piscesae TaxID=27915 RepID=A0AAD9MU02_RIDPI|nr:hypothetical protein NP493_3864g00003 [Ridgeia piscesae]KAK2186036.1 hypothetical protein NP493_216g03071 [Ridgeia piscesae]